jgi:hypothetical protein
MPDPVLLSRLQFAFVIAFLKVRQGAEHASVAPLQPELGRDDRALTPAR